MVVYLPQFAKISIFKKILLLLQIDGLFSEISYIFENIKHLEIFISIFIAHCDSAKLFWLIAFVPKLKI